MIIAALLCVWPAAVPSNDAAAAAQLYKTRCALCHGHDGRGDGPAAAALNPKPRDFSLQAWQQSVSDEAIEKIIVAGGLAVKKSGAMPPNPDLAGKRSLVVALRQLLRHFGATPNQASPHDQP